MKKIKSNYIIIALFIIVVIGLIIVLNRKENNTPNKDKYTIVSNVSTFFTVEGCVNRYLNSLSKGNIEDIMILVDKNYIENNGLNNENILEHLGKKDGDYSFSAKKMYSKQNNSEVKYYIYGLLKEETLDSRDYGVDFYIIVNIQNNETYSIEPLNEELFEEVSR